MKTILTYYPPFSKLHTTPPIKSPIVCPSTFIRHSHTPLTLNLERERENLEKEKDFKVALPSSR
jgi:hypothetical protein